MFSVESTDFKPKRNRMFSADSDISAIELDNNSTTKETVVTSQTTTPHSPTDSMTLPTDHHVNNTATITLEQCDDNDEIEMIVKHNNNPIDNMVIKDDPLCIADVPDDVPSNDNNNTTTNF